MKIQEMLSVKSAQEEVLRRARCLPPEEVSIFEAPGRVLREDVESLSDIPPFRNSAMDGYAVISQDTLLSSKEKPVRIKIIEEVPAGTSPRFTLEKGSAAVVMTGAGLPEGADSVVKVEDTRRDGSFVLIEKAVRKNENVRGKGEDVKKGEVVLRQGIALTSPCIGMLAELGRKSCLVTKRPRVSIVATGDEIFEPGEDLPPHGIRNANGYSFFAGVKETGALPIYLGIARDREEELVRKLTNAFEVGDIVITSGGVSVGEYDLVKKVLSELGEIVFSKVRMQPGKPTVFGISGDKLFFGLPGNPVSSVIAFEQFVRPALMKMSGRPQIFRQRVKAQLGEEIRKKPGMTQFLRGKLTRRDGALFVATTGPQGSGILKSLVVADCLMVIPEGETFLPEGSQVEVVLLAESFVPGELPGRVESLEEERAWEK